MNVWRTVAVVTAVSAGVCGGAHAVGRGGDGVVVRPRSHPADTTRRAPGRKPGTRRVVKLWSWEAPLLLARLRGDDAGAGAGGTTRDAGTPLAGLLGLRKSVQHGIKDLLRVTGRDTTAVPRRLRHRDVEDRDGSVGCCIRLNRNLDDLDRLGLRLGGTSTTARVAATVTTAGALVAAVTARRATVLGRIVGALRKWEPQGDTRELLTCQLGAVGSGAHGATAA